MVLGVLDARDPLLALLTLAVLDGALVNLYTLQEGQGEGVGIGLDGLVALTSEGGTAGGPGSMTLMRCELERL